MKVVPELVSRVAVAFSASAPLPAKVNAGERLALVGSVFSADGEECASGMARFAWSLQASGGGDLALAQPEVRTTERVLCSQPTGPNPQYLPFRIHFII